MSIVTLRGLWTDSIVRVSVHVDDAVQRFDELAVKVLVRSKSRGSRGNKTSGDFVSDLRDKFVT